MGQTIIAPPLNGRVVGSIGGSFVLAEWQDPGGPAEPRRPIAPLHLHYRDDEAWYVLQGALRVQMGENEIDAPAGSSVYVPRGTAHTYWNPGPAPCRYLLVTTSNIFRLIQELHTLTDRSLSAVQAVFRKYDSELLDT